jgi:stress response protein SCP2
MEQSPTLSKSELLFLETPESTRLMVGLSWEEKKVDHKDLLSSHFIIAFSYILSIAMSLPKNIFNLIFKKRFLFPQNTLAHSLYSAERKDKLDDDDSVRETEYRLYDLDLVCYFFDKENILRAIAPSEKNLISPDGKIYHSGEDFTGQGVYDDETIYFNLKNAHENNASYFIAVISDCKHDFGTLDNSPIIRIVDSRYEKNLHEFKIEVTSNSAMRKYAYLHGKMSRHSNEWYFESINLFFETEEEMLKYLKSKTSGN